MAMHDSRCVCRLQGLSDVSRDGQCFLERDGSMRNAICQCRTFDEFEDKSVCLTRLFEPIDRGDVRMVERGENLRFTSEPCQAISVSRERVR
jgi:hypothetical protein